MEIAIAGWLAPTERIDFDPDDKDYLAFCAALESAAQVAWEAIDFAHCDMPDEYAGYAWRFAENWEDAVISANETSNLLVTEVVRRSCGTCTVAEGFISEEQIRQIAHHILLSMRELGMDIKEIETPLDQA